MREQILPSLSFPNDLIQAQAIKCLGIFMMTTPKFAQDYSQSLIQYLHHYEKVGYQMKMKEIISIKCLSDLYILYDIKAPEFEIRDYGEMLIRIALKSDIRITIEALETLCRFLFYKKFEDSQYFLTVLMILWLEPVSNPQTAKATQIVTGFFKRYCSESIENLESLQKSIQIFLNLICHTKSGTMEFNQNYIKWDIQDLTLVIKVLSSVVQNQMSYTNINNLQIMDEQHVNDNQYIGPQEKLFMFFLKKIQNLNKSCEDYKYIFSKLIPLFDFHENSKYIQLLYFSRQIQKFFAHFNQNFKELENFQKEIEKQLDLLKLFHKHSEEQEREQDIHFVVMQQNIDDEIIENSQIMQELYKNLLSNDVIVKSINNNTNSKLNEKNISQIFEQYAIGQLDAPYKKKVLEEVMQKTKIQDNDDNYIEQMSPQPQIIQKQKRSKIIKQKTDIQIKRVQRKVQRKFTPKQNPSQNKTPKANSRSNSIVRKINPDMPPPKSKLAKKNPPQVAIANKRKYQFYQDKYEDFRKRIKKSTERFSTSNEVKN